MSLRALRPTVWTLLALLGLSVVVGGSGPATADPAYQQPEVGSCHGYAYSALGTSADPSPEVTCAGPHTAQTVAVLQAPSGVSAAKSARVLLPQCYAAVSAALGVGARKEIRTAYDLAVFGPSPEQLAQGARWVRCDVVLLGGKQLQALPTPLVGAGALGDTVARCAAGRGSRTTTCDRPHTYRSTRVVTLRGRFPGERGFQAAARRCGRGYAVYAPNRTQWKAGYHAVVCLKPTRR